MPRTFTIVLAMAVLIPSFSTGAATIRDLGKVRVYQAFESPTEKEKVEYIASESLKETMTRTWPVNDNEIRIKSDLNGDGYLDELSIKVIYLNGIYRPVVVFHGQQHLLLWPYQKFSEVKVGDIDNDRDADMILPNDLAIVMDYEKKGLTRPALDETINNANDLLANGDRVGAFKEAFRLFAGLPYKLGAAGEGTDGEFDRDPEVVTDAGDCVITLEQLLAILNGDGNYDGFYDALLRIRYLNGQKRYEKRNHFNEVDWLPNNISAGFIRDIMPAILPDAPIVHGIINKKNWYASKDSLEGDFSDLSPVQLSERINKLKGMGKDIPEETVDLAYYPFEKMFILEDGEYKLAEGFVKGLPEISIFNMVNKGKVAKDKDGNWMTDVIISHTGFLVKDDDGNVVVYHSTSATDAGLATTTQEELLSFLLRRFIGKDNTTIVGFNLTEPGF